jgi:DNA-binding MarR family transcriptional regulator
MTVSERLSDLALNAWQALLHAHYEVVRRLDAELRAEHDLTFNEYDVLLRLARAARQNAARLPMSVLAERVMLSPSGLTRAVDRLVKAKLVARERDEEDARVIYAQLTTAGHAIVRRAARTHLRGIREHFTGRLTERQLRQIVSALQVITGPHRPH